MSTNIALSSRKSSMPAQLQQIRSPDVNDVRIFKKSLQSIDPGIKGIVPRPRPSRAHRRGKFSGSSGTSLFGSQQRFRESRTPDSFRVERNLSKSRVRNRISVAFPVFVLRTPSSRRYEAQTTISQIIHSVKTTLSSSKPERGYPPVPAARGSSNTHVNRRTELSEDRGNASKPFPREIISRIVIDYVELEAHTSTQT